MRRRVLLAVLGMSSVAGCLGGAGSAGGDGTPPTDRLTDCEEEYIENEVVTRENDTIVDELNPTVVESESRSDGVYVVLETRFGTERSPPGEPTLHSDYLVTAHYLVTEDAAYRTENPDVDPREGTELGC